MLLRRTLATTLLVLLALGAGMGVAGASSPVDATQTDGANLTTYAAPGDALADLRSGADTDSLTPRQRVTPADTLVVPVSAPNLDATVADQPGNTTTDRFRELLSGGDASLTAVEISADDDSPRVVDLTPEHLVVRHVDGNTFDLLYDTDELRTTADTNGNGLADDGGRTPISTVSVFQFQFAVDGATAGSSLGFFPAAVTFSTPRDDGVVLSPLPNQRLVGRTQVAPGTPLSISVAARDGSFRIERTTTVTGRQQSFANLSLDLSDAPAGIPLVITARRDGRDFGETTGRLVELTASFAARSADATRTELRLRNVSFTSGGFLAVTDGEGGPLVANRYVSAGDRDSLTLRYRRELTGDSAVVTAYVDVDGDQVLERSGPDRPFRRGGDPVSTAVGLGDPTTATPTESRTTAPPTTPPPTTATPTTSTRTDTHSTTRARITDASGDGFGVGPAVAALAVALVALVRRT
jgi:hypothetical protein